MGRCAMGIASNSAQFSDALLYAWERGEWYHLRKKPAKAKPGRWNQNSENCGVEEELTNTLKNQNLDQNLGG